MTHRAHDGDDTASPPATSELRAGIEDARSSASGIAEGLLASVEKATRLELRLAQLERRVVEMESDSAELARMLVDAEHQTARLTSLYVATYQLHSTLDPGEVRATIAEIAVNLLGAERFVLLARTEPNTPCAVTMAERLEGEAVSLFEEQVYRGGDPMIDAALEDGAVRIGPEPGARPLAVVPLIVQQSVVGALVILKLFDHKSTFGPQDRELLDLIAAHAASALYTAQVHSTADRKLRTLEGLVKLARGG